MSPLSIRYGPPTALGVLGMVMGYFVPIVGTIGMIVVFFAILGALFDDQGALVGLVLSPFAILVRWIETKDEYLWSRRAPFIGVVLGTFVRWISNEAFATGAM